MKVPNGLQLFMISFAVTRESDEIINGFRIQGTVANAHKSQLFHNCC